MPPTGSPSSTATFPGSNGCSDKKPDVAVVVFNDHGNSLFLDRVPTFAVGCAQEYKPVDEGWGPSSIPPFKGAVDFSWHFVDTLVDHCFDPDDHSRRSTSITACRCRWSCSGGGPAEWPVRWCRSSSM